MKSTKSHSHRGGTIARHEDIHATLARIAPLLLEIATDAQRASAELAHTDWAMTYLTRTASLNQIVGSARWRITGDSLVRRAGDLPEGIELTTTDEEQNQGRYYLGHPECALVFTIRRKAHRDEDLPGTLQLQLESVLAEAPPAYEDGATAVYLAVPPLGQDPYFEIKAKGADPLRLPLAGLLENMPQPVELPTPEAPPAGASVRSTRTPPSEQREEPAEDDRS